MNFKKQVSLIIAICFLTIHASFSQTLIKGKVIDAISKQPIESAFISILNENINTATDKYGQFQLTIKTSNTPIMVSLIGYQPSILPVNSANIKVELQPVVVNLKDINISNNTSTKNKFNSITKIDLDLKPVKNTQELMSIVPGLFVAQHAGGGKAEQIFLRGFDSDHGTDIQVSVDGMPVNMVSHAHGQGYADAHFIIPETINNIDYGTGPYYTQHGNLNTAGYVSFATYNNIPQSRIQVEAGRFNTFRTLAMIDLLKKNKEKQSAYIAGEFNYTDGPTLDKQSFNRINIFGKYNLALSNNTFLTASLSAFSSKWDASGQVPTRAIEDGTIDRFGSIDPSEGGNTERYNANIILARTFKNGDTWENQTYYSMYKFNLFSNFTFFANDPINGDGIQQAENRNIFGYSSKYNQRKVYKNWTLNSTYGVGIRYDATNNSQLANVVKRKFLSNVKLGNIKEANAFGYINEQVNFEKFLIEGGLRFDYLHFSYLDKLNTVQSPSQGKSILSPKINIQYTFNKSIQVYIKAGKGFHSNDSRVVTANNGNEILPAAYGRDIGFILKPTKNLFINVAFWQLNLDQEFVYVGDDGNIEPSGKSRRQGIDVLARYQFNNNIFANINYNFTNPKSIGAPKGEDYIPLAPTATSTGGLFYKKKLGINGGLSYRYIKDRAANEDNSIVAKGYFLMDASINYSRPKYEIGLAAENIFNIKWNEAQFATESRLYNEPAAVTELNFTPGTPLFIRAKLAVFF